MEPSDKSDSRAERKGKSQIAHDAILLSRIISDKLSIKISFLDGEFIVDQLKWHTREHLGLKSGKVVTKHAIKYWEIVEG